MEKDLDYYFRHDPEDVKKVVHELIKLKIGEHIHLERTKMYREDKQKLISTCNSFILFMQSRGDYTYWLSTTDIYFFRKDYNTKSDE